LLNKTHTLFLLLCSFAILSSCAVHSSFPFICFKKECISQAWSGTRKEAGGKRSLKQNVKIFSTKIKSKIRKSKGSPIDITKVKFNEPLLDSLLNDTSHIDKYIKIVFENKTRQILNGLLKDSTYLKSSFLIVSKNDKMLINFYLVKHQIKNIKEITISSIMENTNGIEGKDKLSYLKTKRIAHYLIRTGVKKHKIKIR
jgi:hypothetical protein